MTLQITLNNEEVHVIRGVYYWDIDDKVINIYSHTSERDKNNNVCMDWMHKYKVHVTDVKDMHRIGGEEADVL